MNSFFEIVIQSSILILLVIIVRTLFRNRISAKAMYAFWLLPLLRLIIPVSFKSSFSPMNLFTSPTQAAPIIGSHTVEPFNTPPVLPALTELPAQAEQAVAPANANISSQLSTLEILLIIWIVGMAAVLLYFTIVNIKFLRRLMRSAAIMDIEHELPKRTKVFVSPDASSPCVWGVFWRRIVLTKDCINDSECLEFALQHETVHIKQNDTLISFLRIAICSVYWFNPLVWVAAKLSNNDCELSCDAKVVSLLSFDKRIEYGHKLIKLISGDNDSGIARIASTATTMIGGNNMKNRIKRIANKKRNSKVVTLVLATLLAVALLVSCTSANDITWREEIDAFKELTPLEQLLAGQKSAEEQATSFTSTITNTKYKRIVKDFSGYLPTMSSLRGIPIEFEIDNIVHLSVTCDHGMLLSYRDDYKNGYKSFGFYDNEEIVGSSSEPILYWVPISTTGTSNIQSAILNIFVTDIYDESYHQRMRISLDETYSLTDLPDDDITSLYSPRYIIYKKAEEKTILRPTDLFYRQAAIHAARRIEAVESVSIAATETNDKDVQAWKQQNDWVEYYYPTNYLAGSFVGADDSRIELSENTRILMFLEGELADSMLLYNEHTGAYSAPIFLGYTNTFPSIEFDTSIKSTSSQENVKVTMYAFEYRHHPISDPVIYVRVEIKNTSSKELIVESSPYITLNVSLDNKPIGDYIGMQWPSNKVTLQPGETLDVGSSLIAGTKAGTYSLEGSFGELVLPKLKIKLD